jgi:uncharacterized membrane protein YcaP (DUF421 family)
MDLVLRATLMYFIVLIMLRLTTRKIMRSATPLEMAVIFFFGGIGVQPLLAGDRSVTGAVVAMATIAGLHISLSWLETRWPVLGRITKGAPVVVYTQGKWDQYEMQMLRVQQADVLAEMRQQGIKRLDEVEAAVIEHNGGITIVRAK